MSSPEMKSFGTGTSESRATGTGTATAETRFDTSDRSKFNAAFSNRFEILKPVATYSNAVCYLAEDLCATPLNALVRLKVFSGQSANDSKGQELFKAEILAAAKLSHKNIMKSSLPEEAGGVHFAVLEHRAGAETLSQLLDREAWLGLKLAVGIILQITDALEYAHKQGVLHLAIQPDCIIIDRDGTALVSDFGLPANVEYGWAHKERSLRCPAQYISPEQVSGGPVDARSDLYLLGLLIYKILTDRLPFGGEDTDAVKHKQINQSPMPPHLFCENVPSWMSGLITCLLEKNPAKRFQSVSEFRASLNEFAVSRLGIIQPLNAPQVAAKVEEVPVEAVAQAEHTAIIQREKWEPPVITVIDPPLEQLSSVEPPPSIRIANQAPRHQHNKYAEPDPMEIKYSPRIIAATDRRNKQWLLLALIIGLAMAVAGGLFALARPNPSNAVQEQIPAETPAAESGANDSTGAAIPGGRIEGNSTMTGEPPAAGMQMQSALPKTSSATVRKRQASSIRSSKPRGSRTAKRKPRRAVRYRR